MDKHFSPVSLFRTKSENTASHRQSNEVPKYRRSRRMLALIAVITGSLANADHARSQNASTNNSPSANSATVSSGRIYMPAYIPGDRSRAIVFGGIESYRSPGVKANKPIVAPHQGTSQGSSSVPLAKQAASDGVWQVTQPSRNIATAQTAAPQAATQFDTPAQSGVKESTSEQSVELAGDGFVPRTETSTQSSDSDLAPNTEAALRRERSRVTEADSAAESQNANLLEDNSSAAETTAGEPNSNRRPPRVPDRGPVYDGLPKRGAGDSGSADGSSDNPRFHWTPRDRDFGPGQGEQGPRPSAQGPRPIAQGSGQGAQHRGTPGGGSMPARPDRRPPEYTFRPWMQHPAHSDPRRANRGQTDVQVTMDNILENESVRQLLKLMEENIELKAEMNLLKAKMEMKNAFKEAEASKDQLNALREEAEKAEIHRDELHSDLHQEIHGLESHVAELEHRLEGQHETEVRLREEAQRFENESREARDAARAALRESEEGRRRLEQQFRNAQRALDEARRGPREIESQTNQLQARLAEVQRENAQRAEQLALKSAEVRKLQEAMEKLNAKERDHQEHQHSETDESKAKAKDTREDASKNSQATAELKKALAKEKSASKALQQKCDLLRKENTALKHKLESVVSESKKHAAESKKKFEAAIQKLESESEKVYRRKLDREVESRVRKATEDIAKEKTELTHRTRVLEEKLKSTEKQLAKVASDLATANKKLNDEKSDDNRRSNKKRKTSEKKKTSKDADEE